MGDNLSEPGNLLKLSSFWEGKLSGMGRLRKKNLRYLIATRYLHSVYLFDNVAILVLTAL